MQRILVIGCPGSGKSRFSHGLAQQTGLPLVHLDRLFWQAGWQEPDRAEWKSRLQSALEEPAWVMDGNYTNTLAWRLGYADTVIVLDPPRWLCLYRVFRRTLGGWGQTRADMAEGCPERFNLEFLLYIWMFRKRQTPRIEAALQEFGGEILRID